MGFLHKSRPRDHRAVSLGLLWIYGSTFLLLDTSSVGIARTACVDMVSHRGGAFVARLIWAFTMIWTLGR